MTKEELKALVASKLEGQGNQTDISGALSVVLNELIDGMGGEVKIIRLGEVDFLGSTSATLPAEQRNALWRSLYGHDFPEAHAEVVKDVKENPVTTLVESFLAKNYDGTDMVFTGGYQFNAEGGEDGMTICIYNTTGMQSIYI